MSTASKTKARSFTGCWACRFKKRRCDEAKPVCSLCLKHGDQCSYDIRLVWQNENIFSVNATQELVSWKKLKNLCMQPNRNRISRRRFRQMTRFRQISPPASDDEEKACDEESESELNDEDEKSRSFTISVRRLKIYNNVLDCVHGKDEKNYEQKFVDQKLEKLLTSLESSCQKRGDHRCGPFHVFPAECAKKSNAKKCSSPRKATLPQLREVEAEITEPISIPNTPISEANSSLSLRPLTGDATTKFLSCRWPDLLLDNGSNFCFQQPAYVKWLTSHIEYMVHALQPDFLEELMVGSVDSSKWLKELPQFSPECQALYLLMLTMIETENKLADFVLDWMMSQRQISYVSFPLIANLLNHSNKIAFLFHCHELLSEATLQDLFQYELTSMLKVNTVRLILQHWSNLMMEQICQCQDTTHAEMQLKFWEMQLQCNEEFYRDICLV